MQTLNIKDFPLKGVRLIEASAGTGKTYTITGIYLRLLVEEKLDVTQILVVTFTVAATAELRGRIRTRIRDALSYLEKGQLEDADNDLIELLKPFQDDEDVRQHLRDALTSMDEASIFTIHGFCQRTLTDSAFESGALFDAEFITDETLLKKQITRDFWRTHFANASADYARWIKKLWPTPDSLLFDVSPLLASPDANITPDTSQSEIAKLEKNKEVAYHQVCEAWRYEQETIRGILDTNKDLSRKVDTWKSVNLENAYSALERYIETNSSSSSLPESFTLFTSGMMHDSKNLKGKKIPPEHPFFDQAETLLAINEKIKSLLVANILTEAGQYIIQELNKRKAETRVLYFDDLLTQLADALKGDGREALATRIRAKYPIAMIDEFQDTDPLQYFIFHDIYEKYPDCGLFMIGDPKQAIYSFRGADIFTYMQARRDTDQVSNHFTLGTNWRSTEALVDAVNQVFNNAQAPFIYDQDIEFYPVQASGKADKEPLLLEGKSPTPLVAWFVTNENGTSKSGKIKPIAKGTAQPAIAIGCAAEIGRLLALGVHGEAMIGEKPLVARDIAVLVRNRHEADEIRTALNTVGIASVFISKDSVFQTEEADELSHLLLAVAEPSDSKALRCALATRMMGWSAVDIDRLNNDEMEWEGKVQSMHEYHSIWLAHGFMPMFHSMMRKEGIIGRLLSMQDGERRITNVLQLAELAQVVASTNPGSEKILRWLADERAASSENNEEQQLRLESDENLIQIVTIHKSKGLEYPIVFLPYIWGSRAADKDTILSYHDEKTREVCLDLGSSQYEENSKLVQRETLAEDLRILYVALTRAQYRCYFSWGQFNGAANSGLGWLLHQDSDGAQVVCNMASLPDKDLYDDLEKLNANGVSRITITDLPNPDAISVPSSVTTENAVAKIFSGKIKQDWRMTSFSGLTAKMKHGQEYRVERPDYDSLEGVTPDLVVEANVPSKFTFPRGARAGECLHELFENIDFPNAKGDALASVVTRKLDQYGYEEKWRSTVCNWVGEVLDTPLNQDKTLTLRKISTGKRLVEMAFHYPLVKLTPAGLTGVVKNLSIYTSNEPSLDFQPLKGMMKGFIDLIIEHEGKFYVLDYKSNHLGNSLAFYHKDVLSTAILLHHYELQYLIYTVALHRYLRQRIPDYEYTTHFGGVYYLFLRGMDPEKGPECGVYYDLPNVELIEQLDGLFAGETMETADVE